MFHNFLTVLAILIFTAMQANASSFADKSFEDFDDTLFIDIVETLDGDTLIVDFIVFSCDNIEAFQWTVDYNPNTTFHSLQSDYIDRRYYNDFGGYATFLWLDVPQTLNLNDGTTLFTMKFLANGETSAETEFSNEPTSVEIFNTLGELVYLETNRFNSRGKTLLKATVYHDKNSNCIHDDDESIIPNSIFELSNGLIVKSDEKGIISRYLNPGSYEVNTTNNLWSVCSDNSSFTIDEEPTTLLEVELGLQALISCEMGEISVATPFLRRCFENTYSFTYCNIGTTPLTDPSIRIDFSPGLIYKSASINISSNSQNQLIASGETLEVGACRQFTVVFEPDCDATELGETHCVTATIGPYSPCVESQAWSGADIIVNASCKDDEVEFTIKNAGDGDMSIQRSFIVIEDDVMLPQHDKDFDLNAGDSLKYSLPSNGRTFRLVAEQESNHPFPNMPTAAIEGCGQNGDADVSLGFINQFAESDDAPYIDKFCAEIIGSYDPNDKISYPKGYSTEKYVYANSALEYLIRFQNTGTDTAFTVVIEDSIRQEFDLTSVSVGPASHPFTWAIENERTLVFSFDNILLPDSSTNQVASNGFIKYKITQVEDNPDGTILENDANIFFDFNEPILTNQTLHTIGSAFLISDVLPSISESTIPFTVFPNPTLEGLWIEKLDLNEKGAIMHVYNTEGRLISRKRLSDNLNYLSREELARGLNFYTITTAEGKMYSGKITVLF